MLTLFATVLLSGSAKLMQVNNTLQAPAQQSQKPANTVQEDDDHLWLILFNDVLMWTRVKGESKSHKHPYRFMKLDYLESVRVLKEYDIEIDSVYSLKVPPYRSLTPV